MSSHTLGLARSIYEGLKRGWSKLTSFERLLFRLSALIWLAAAISMAMSNYAFATNDISMPPPVHNHVKPKVNNHVKSSSSSKATSSSSSSNRLDNRQGQVQRQHQTAQGGAAEGGAGGAGGYGGSVQYQSRHTASTAYAPSIPPTVNCAGSLAAGAQGTGFGLSFGGSHIDPECQRQELAKTAYAMGDRAAAEEILCDSETYRNARRRAGRPCATVQVTPEEAAVYSGTDPIVRRRLGMPELRQ